MSPEDMARRHEEMSGYELVDYAEIALPIWQLSLEAIQNEDNVSIDGDLIVHEQFHVKKLSISEDHLVVVADGMGGHVKGELASKITVEAIASLWRRQRLRFESIEAIRSANRQTYDAMTANPNMRGMGATVVGAHVRRTALAWFNLGDSRGYVFRDKTLEQFTVDHVPRGATGAGRARTHSITQSVGGGRNLIEVWPAVGLVDIRENDLFLFCTDGLTDVVSDHLICSLIGQSTSLLHAAEALVGCAQENGAPDNISVVLFQA